jgi:hypothetical protein
MRYIGHVNTAKNVVRPPAGYLKSGYRVGAAVGGWAPEPFALAGEPGMNRLQPLLPETLRR